MAVRVDHPHLHQQSIRTASDDTCWAPPSPELTDKWAKELTALKKGSKSSVRESLGIQRHPRSLGFDDGVIIPSEEFPLGTPTSAIRSASSDRAPLRGTVRVAVVLVDFSDKAMTATQSHFKDLFFSSGVLPHGSVKEYYSEVTNGLVTLSGDVVGPYRMPKTMAYYANNNFGIGRPPGSGAALSPEMALAAAQAANNDVNFAPYDNDGNGYVDAFIVVHAGAGSEVTGNKTEIWSHKSTLASAYNADGTRIFGYLTVPEDAKIGVTAHELGHLLFGFPDLYDTDYSSEGIGNWCLMAGGTWNGGGDIPAHASAWCKVNQGWVSTTNVMTDSSTSIPDVKVSHNVHRLWKDGAGGSEYFLVENRQRTGFDSGLPGDGLLVWHVDENQPGNTDENHYKVDLLQADGKRDLNLKVNRGDGGDAFPGSASVTSISSETTPSTKSYAGQDTCVSITAISGSSATMTATLSVHCGVGKVKEHWKDSKDLNKEGKEIKEEWPEHKQSIKDVKDGLKEGAKEVLKEVQKDGKELAKESKDGKELAKESKEFAKEFGKDIKDLKNKEVDLPFGHGDPFGRGGQAGGSAHPMGSGGVLESLAARVTALEQQLGSGAQPFIGQELRPDLIGGGNVPAASDPGLNDRMAAGDALAKRQFDTPPR